MSVWKRIEHDDRTDAATHPVTSGGVGRINSRPAAIATVGPSITIEGDVTGEEDLLIEGRIGGKITLPQNSVTVGSRGRVRAEVTASSITVEGEVEGDLFAEEEVVIRPTGKVRGNIVAPRVSLESGCRFKGSIDMERVEEAKESAKAKRRQAAKEKAAPPADPGESLLRTPVQPAISSTS